MAKKKDETKISKNEQQLLDGIEIISAQDILKV